MNKILNACVAQLDRAFRYERKGRGFESLHTCFLFFCLFPDHNENDDICYLTADIEVIFGHKTLKKQKEHVSYIIGNMDRLTKEQRHKNMKAVKNKDSKIEILLRKALWSKGYRYRKNYTKLEGKPDIVLQKYKVAIFCDSEFWHGYDWDVRKQDIKSNRDFWIKKIESNIQRDVTVNKILKNQGWKVVRFWGREIQKDLETCINKIEKEIGVQ